jgi:hypothetical protein
MMNISILSYYQENSIDKKNYKFSNSEPRAKSHAYVGNFLSQEKI